MSTRDKIMDIALHMFSERGYEAVSVRDICGAVGIKESTMYYHFKNKQDILDSLIDRFENYIDSLLVGAGVGMPSAEKVPGADKVPGAEKMPDTECRQMDSYMMDSYLFDPFCNLMLRLAMIEQFHNEKLRQLYEKTMFIKPYEIQKNIFNQFVLNGTFSEEEADWIVQECFSHMTVLTYRYLLNGELTEERKTAYSHEIHEFYGKAMGRWMKAARR